MNKPLIIDYYTDILCVWAWIAQRRIDELNQKLGNDIDIRHHYVDVFGDVQTKMDTQWAQKGGYSGFAEHVQKSARLFEDIQINPQIWSDVKPATSANAHLVIKAVEIVYDSQKSIDIALHLRKAFFVQALDIGDHTTLIGVLDGNGCDSKAVNACINDGSAIASLMNDYQSSKQQSIKGSPSYVMDGGRQTLYGNVGYRVLKANVEELLKHPHNEASWC